MSRAAAGQAGEQPDEPRPRVTYDRWREASDQIRAPATSQLLADEDPQRRALIVQNVSADTLWLQFNGEAAQGAPSFRLIAGATLTMQLPGFVDTGRVEIIGPNAGAAFTAKVA